MSHETGLTTDMNPEIEMITSVNNNNNNDKVSNVNKEVPSTSSAATSHLDDCLWGYYNLITTTTASKVIIQ